MFAALFLTGCAAFLTPNSGDNSYRQIGMQEAVNIMTGSKLVHSADIQDNIACLLVHIPGAINIPNESIAAAEIPELPDKDQLILVYCRSGNRSKQASAKLVALGYTNIVEFGGIIDWPGETVPGCK